MREKIGSYFNRYYRIGLLLSVMAGLFVFGLIAWHAGAAGNTGEGPAASATPPDTDPSAATERRENELERGRRLTIAGDRVEGSDDEQDYDTRDSPPDTKHYWRPLRAADRIPLPRAPEAVNLEVYDTVVSNTNPNLTNTDTAGDGETNIAINPANVNEVVITAFSGGWGANAPLWHSLDGGETWTEQFTVPVPTGYGAGCPCDQSVDYGRGNRVSGTFLKTDIFTGTTTNPASAASWNWFVSGGFAQKTNQTAVGDGNADQPWLLVNPAPGIPAQDNVYVAYDDFNGGPNMRVAVASGTNPPNFTIDNQSGISTGFVNPGHRLAENPTNGTVYSLFQRRIAAGSGGSQNIDYMLNRSTDGGVTWGLNGSPTGIVVGNGDSTQPYPKFGTVNALLGGVDHAAVDPATGDIYYAYGTRDSGTSNNRIAIRRITNVGGGLVAVGPEVFVTGQVQAAIPSVAVNSDGAVGVFYYTYNGIVSGFPQFTARIAISTDQAATFSTDVQIQTFASSAVDDGGGSTTRQRVLGDYMQMKAVGKAFFGSYTGNGATFGRPISNHDPIFFKIAIAQSNTTTAVGSSVNPSVSGQPVTFTATVTAAGQQPIGKVSFRDGATPIAACQNIALNASSQAVCSNVVLASAGVHNIFADYGGDVAFNSSSDSIAQTVNKAPTTTTIVTDAPDPSVFGQTFPVTFTVVPQPPGAGTPTGNVVVTVSGGPETCTGTVAAGTCNIQLNAIGARTLTATYAGDANYLGSNDTEAHQVDKADTLTAVASSLNPSTFGQSVTFTATVSAKPPGAGTPTGTVTFNIDGNLYCINTPLNGSQQAACTQAGLPALAAGNRVVVAIYNGDGNFNGSAGSLAGGQVVNKANTTTVITADTPDPSLVNQPYTVTWTVTPTPVYPGSGTPTGTVTVNGGTGGGSCSAPATAGGCQLTPTTVGTKTIQATFAGDANFNGSASSTTTHLVNLLISGTLRNGVTLVPIANETVYLVTCANVVTTTNASGVFSFTGAFTGNCAVFPAPIYSEPYVRNYNSVNTNITNADFLIFTADNFPRTIQFPTQFVVPGSAGSMPVIMNSLENEVSVAFSFSYDLNPFAQPPTVVCGANAPGCTITQNNSILGKVGVTITPAGGVFTRPDGTPLEGPEAAGPKEIAKINFQTLPTSLPSTDFTLGNSPVSTLIVDGSSNILLGVFKTPVRVVFAQGIEGDVAGRNAGNGTVDSTDVVQVRRFATGLDTPSTVFNEYQRADVAPANTKGNGLLDATDVVQVRRYASGLDSPPSSGGPGLAAPSGPIAPPVLELGFPGIPTEVTVGRANATTESRVSVPVELKTSGNEMAASFTLRYDETRLSDPEVTLAGAPDGVTLTANTKEPGVIRVLLDSSTPLSGLSKDAISLINIAFDVAQSAPTGDTSVDIYDVIISDVQARPLLVRSNPGMISISGPNRLDDGTKAGRRPSLGSSMDLVEEWLNQTTIILRPRLENEPQTRTITRGRFIQP